MASSEGEKTLYELSQDFAPCKNMLLSGLVCPVLSVFWSVRGIELAFVTIYLAGPTVFSTELAIRLAWPTFQKAVFQSLCCDVGRLKN